MWPSLAITVFLCALLATALRFHRAERLEEQAVLRHTINVNLDILDSELAELKAIASSAPASASQLQASRLLQNSQKVAQAARTRVQIAGSDELEKMLGLVFGAMNQSTDARRLLNACRPS